MNDHSPQNEPSQAPGETGETGKRGLSTGMLVLIALLAGAAVSVATLYVTGRFDGNAMMTAEAETGDICGMGDDATTGTALKPLLTGEIAAMAVRDPETPVGDLAFNDGDGKPVTLADTGSKVRLVNLWATWCAPCREEMPWLDQLQAEKGGDKFEVVAISVDGGDDEKPRAFFDEIGISNLAFYHDPTIDAFNRLKREGLAFGLPVTLLVNENNCVIANMNGPAHWAGPDAYALIDGATGAAD